MTAAARVPVTGGRVTETVSGDDVRTLLQYRADAPTLVAPMPGRTPAGPCDAGTYATLYGPMNLCRGTSVEFSTPLVQPGDGLDLSAVSGSERAELERAVRADAATVGFSAKDTYFGGKQLGRAANLLRIAQELELGDVARTLRAGMAAQLRRWAEPNGCADRTTECFTYDPALRGVVGLESSFGSEEFNDHYFHYGYFLFAAAVAAKDDPALAAQIAPVIDLLAADIGSAGDAAFPRQRAFDSYGGHSWASGFSPFGDGNNQESSSEAVNAYNGLALWAGVRGDSELRGRAVAMLSREADSARRYWLEPTLIGTEFVGFGHRIVSLNWGGKRDYATWFSAEPNAILGIQLIPMAPVVEAAGDPERIRAAVAEAAPNGFDVGFGDYLLMYLAGADRAKALAAARSLPERWIDDGNTRSYMLARILAR
jgi:endoglucanase Acf2